MDNWATVVVSLIGSGIAGPASAELWKYLGTKSIERQKAQESRELFVGATSHMAAVAFDKHIGFCEEYVQEMSKALHKLIQDESAERSRRMAMRLSRIRQKWALWLTQEIENELDQFERKIEQIGGAAPVYDANGAPNEGSIETVIAYLREVLRTEELTALRNELVIRSSRKPRHVV
jgi:hypothetical protein